MKRLTPLKIGNAKAEPGTRRYLQDDQVRQMQLLVTDKGNKSFVLYTRLPGKAYASRLALGSAGELTLEQARIEARKWLDLIKQGFDPRDVRARQIEMVGEQRANTFGSIIEDYIKLKVANLARPDFIAATLRREFVRDVVIDGQKVKGLGSKPIRDVTWQHILMRVNAKRLGDPQRGVPPRPTMARHLLAMVKAALNWAEAQEAYGIEKSIVATKKVKDFVGDPPVRERVLSDPEIRAVWAAAGEVGYPFGDVVKMLMLTAQRRDEVSLAKRSEFSWVKVDDGRPAERVWTIPGVRVKKRKVHVLPVTEALGALLSEIGDKSGGEYLFSTTGGDRPFSGFSKSKKALDRLMKKHLTDELGADVDLPRWTLHDIRRTVRTRMSRFTSSDTAELILNHQSRNIRRVYDRYDYLDEKFAALGKWSAVLNAIIFPASSNVVALKTGDKSSS